MTDEVIIIVPELTPGAGGVADYNLRVVEEWGARQAVRFILPKSAAALRTELPARGGKVLLQYSAYGFSRYGYPRWLLRALTAWRRNSGGRLVVMLHEIWAFWPRLNKNHLLQHFHRRDLGRLVRLADAVFTSTASQAEHLRQLCPGGAIQVLPVGSNIRRATEAGLAREPGLAVLFGRQGSRVQALQKMHHHLRSLAAAQRIRKLISAGAGHRQDREEHELLAALPLAGGFELRGALAEEEISALLAQASFGISAQDELSLTKSGTFMAYAAHGLNILSPAAGPATPPPICWTTHPEELLREDFSAEGRAEKLRAWQEETCSWPHIAETFAAALQLKS